MKQDSKKLKRKLLYLTTIILTLAGCASEDYVGNRELHEANENGRPVSFSLAAAPQTRAVSGQEAADLLNNNFVVWGDKTVNSATQTVFDNYQVNYVTNTASTTTTNSTGWEYVGYKNLPNGTSTTLGIDQTIKFWDYGASQYHFFAYSLGKGVEVTPATDPKTYTYATTTAMNTGGYTLSGTGDQLKACYISDKKTISPSGSSGTQVELQFRNFASNVKMAFYETILGYSVNNVQFYPAVDGTVGDVPYLYASSSALPTAGTYAVSFDETSGKAQVSAPTGGSNASNLAFGTALTYTAGKEYREPQTDGTTPYIGRASNAATPTTAVTVLPNPSGTDLHLKVDYTLVARDGYGETIHVRGATATVPAAYTKWQPNYSYTYLFKISDSELSPITFEAFGEIDNTTDNEQGTITTVDDKYSITTHQSGDTDEQGIAYESSPYVTGRPIEVSVVKFDGFENVSLVEESTTDFVRIYHQKTINEWVVEIDTTEPVTPTAYENGMVRFEPTQTGTYRIEFWHKEGDADAEMMAVKIVAVGAKLHGTGHTGTDLGDGGSMELELEENATP